MKTRRLVVLLVALGLGALAADWMTRDPGYVLLTWGDYALETSLGIAVLALAVLGASAATMYVSLRGMFGAIRQIIEWTASLSETDTAAKRRQLSQKAQRLLLSGQHGSLRRRLDRALPEMWESELLDCYGLVSDTKPQQRLESAMAWLQDHPDDAGLLLCLGRLSMRCGHWEQASEYLKHSLEAKPTPAACAELARIEARAGNAEASQAMLQRGLNLSAGPLADIPG